MTCVLFWQAVIDVDGEGDMLVMVLLWLDTEVMLPSIELEDVVELTEASRIAATWVLSAVTKVGFSPLLTKHWPGPAPFKLPAYVQVVHCVESNVCELSQYAKQSFKPFGTL